MIHLFAAIVSQPRFIFIHNLFPYTAGFPALALLLFFGKLYILYV